MYELAQAHGIAVPATVSGSTEGFRLRARLAIRGRSNSPKIGLFEADSHRVVHIPYCRVQHSLINRVASIVRRALVDTGVTCYSDGAHVGLARYLQVVVERSSQTAQVVLVANSATPEPLAACLDLIRERLGSELHSLWLNTNCGEGNTILGPDYRRWYGADSVIEHFGGAAIHYPPGAFGQNNLDIAQRIVERVRDDIPAGAVVAEFYAGVGAIGLSILDRSAELRMNEVGESSLQGLELGLAQLDGERRAKVSVSPGLAGTAIEMASGAQVVVADPPRKGLDPQLCTYLSEQAPERFIYVSCGLESLIKDCAQLTSRGKLRLAQLTAYNLMPFTEHVETVARFERA